MTDAGVQRQTAAISPAWVPKQSAGSSEAFNMADLIEAAKANDDDYETIVGFEVVIPPKLFLLGGILPVFRDRFEWRKDVYERFAKLALEEYNKNENKKLELVKVIKLNEQLVSGTIYYLTLLVKDKESDNDATENLICWAKVWVGIREEVKEFMSFKILTEKEVMSFNILREEK